MHRAVKTQPKLHFSQNVKACHFSMNHFSEWHVITFGWFGGTFYVMNAQKSAILAGLRSNFYMLVSQKYGSAQNITTQNTQQPKTTNMRYCHPTPQRLCPLPPWIGQWCHQHMALRLPKFPSKASGAGFALNAVGSPFLGAIQIPLENQRDGKGVGLMAKT
jgi:hypothetical protein